MATNYENQKGFYENVKLDENGYILVTGISGGGGATGPAGTSGTSGTSGQAGTSGTSPSGGGAISIINTDTLISETIGATASDLDYSIVVGYNAKLIPKDFNGTGDATGYTSSIAIGSNLTNRGMQGVVMGSDNFGGSKSVLIGSGLHSLRNWPFQPNILIGNDILSNDSGQGAVYMIGQGMQGSSDGHSIGIGGTDTNSSGYITLGRFTISIGQPSGNVPSSAINIGYSNTTSAAGAVALGNNLIASHDNSVVLGINLASVAAGYTHINNLYIKNAPVYADNAAALSAGLVAGQVYRTSTGVLMITY
jgi:hypothetical protein